METTKNKLSPNVARFFHNLCNYVDTKLFYYGSVQRDDYIPNKSDIDIDIFTDNEHSTINKLQHYLHMKKNDFKKVVWVLKGQYVYGHKLKYINKTKGIEAEFSIYNEKFKDIIIKEHINKFVLPMHVSIMLYIIKYLFYKMELLSNSTYNKSKRFILNNCVDGYSEKFLVF